MWAVALLAITFGVYLGGLDTPFLLDDPVNITKSESIRRPLDLASLLADPRAVVTASLRANYLAGEFSVTGYHVLNVLAHAATGWLVFVLSWATLQLPVFAGRYARTAGFLAATVALVFLLHPMQTESVTYVIQRAEIFAGAALLAALLALVFLEGRQRGGAAHGRRGQRGDSRQGRGAERIVSTGSRGPMTVLAAACVFGVYSKPSFAVAPALLAVYDVCFLSRGRWREMTGRAPAYVLSAAAALATFVLAQRHGSFEAGTAGFDIEGITPLGYLSAQPGVVVQYLRVALWPDDLCFDCGYRGPWPVLGSVLGDSVLLPAAILAAIAAASIAAWRRHPLVTFACFGSAVVLAPTSSFVPLADFYVEHRMYLPIAFLAMALVPAMFDAIAAVPEMLRQRRPAACGDGSVRARDSAASAASEALARAQQHPAACGDGSVRARDSGASEASEDLAGTHAPVPARIPGAAIPLSAALIAALALATMSRNETLADPVALMEDALAKAPQNERVHYNLANAYKRLGRLDDAIPHYEAAIRLLPNVVRSYQNLGTLYLEQGRLEDALRVFVAGARAKPDAAIAHRNVANACLRLGRAAQALASANEAIAIDPVHPNGHRLKGEALQKLGRTAEAAAAYRAGLAANPGDPVLSERLEKLESR